MTMDIVIWVASVLCFAAGVVFVFVPVLPGPLIVFGGVLAHAIHGGFQTFSVAAVIVLGVIALAGSFVDNVLNMIGARAFGASWAGLVGVVVGLIVGGIVLFPIGLFIGPFAGAILGEIIRGRSRQEAFKAGLGAFLGYLAGMVAKLAICAGIIGYFTIKMVLL
jgi:uncharacterized protein YqgC (DUF456 family)